MPGNSKPIQFRSKAFREKFGDLASQVAKKIAEAVAKREKCPVCKMPIADCPYFESLEELTKDGMD